MSIARRIGSLAVIAAVTMATAGPGQAQFNCFGRYQFTGAGTISTPYCEDEYLAFVARTYGVSATGDEMRYDLGERQTVCRMIGYDARVRDICNLDEDSDPFRRKRGK